MPGRKFTAGSGYRYGFNGKENDKDAGEGIQDYGMRIYDQRLGRFLSSDPLSPKYPFYSPYQFAGNMPIKFIDLDGGEPAEPGTKIRQIQSGSNGSSDVHSYEWDGKNWNEAKMQEVVITSNPKNNIKEFILKAAADRYAPSAVISVAKLYSKNVDKFQGHVDDLRYNSQKAVGVMLYSFATGQGVRDYKFDLESAVSYDFFHGSPGGRNIASEIETSLYKKINALNIGLSDLKKGWTTKIGITFSPDHTDSPYESFQKHVSSNSIQFFTGGATATVTILGNSMFVSVYNESSRQSFFAHGKFGLAWAAQNVERSGPDSAGEPLSTITQTFETVLNLDASKVNRK